MAANLFAVEESRVVKIVPVRSEEDYARSLSRLEQLFDAEPGTPEADELEVISLLVERYERSRFEVAAPTALEAIRFRMQQEGLTPRDLEPYIGSRSRVFEVLSGTRSLSIDMIRALHRHLGIPAESLIESAEPIVAAEDVEPSRAAMMKLQSTGLLKKGESFGAFLRRAFGKSAASAMLRKTRTERTNAKTDPAALQAWCAAALLKSQEYILPATAKRADVDEAAARKLAVLSSAPDGLLRVRATLAEMGIILVILEHLPGTYLDGAALRRMDGIPVIALTLRHDRIDNFWFTLLHEFAHVACHLSEDRHVIFDDLEIRSSEIIESEADRFAQRSLIPDEIWNKRSLAGFDTADVLKTAAEAGVHPAVVAGRWQREHGDYRKFAKLLGRGEVRRNVV